MRRVLAICSAWSKSMSSCGAAIFEGKKVSLWKVLITVKKAASGHSYSKSGIA